MSRASIRRKVTIWILVLLVCLAGSPANTAQAIPVRVDSAPRASLEDAEPFFDSYVAGQLAEHHVAGAAVALVQDGQVVLAKGYGQANVDEHRPVVAGETMFRLASVTKLFTWTAVMQLVEQGRLDLDADVNTYLDFEIPATYPEPVTLRHLMSHSAGFEEWAMGIFLPTTEYLVPLSEWLPANQPARVRPVGSASSYSNYGSALAGYIVERVSGMSYDDYVEMHILRPLGMNRTTTHQPLPPDLAPYLAEGYAFIDGKFVAQPFDVLQPAPGGSMSATATDVAAFMIAHLQEGQYGDGRILTEATAQQMHSPSFSPDPRLRGYAYGFEERELNGQKVLSHSGDFQHFHSRLDLLPDQEVGLFVTYNSAMDEDLREELLQAFLDRYYPAAPKTVTPPSDFAARAAPFTGQYGSNRHAYSTGERTLTLFRPVYTIRAEENWLVVSYLGEERRFAEVEPLLFEQVDGPERLAFRQDSTGRVEMAFLESNPTMALEPVAWYETAVFTQIWLGLILLLFLSLPVVGLISLIRRRRQPREPGERPALARAAGWTMVAVGGLSWLFLLGTGLAISRLTASLGTDAGATRMLSGLDLLPGLIALLTLAGAALLVPVWRRRYWRLSGRIYYTALVAAAVGFTWFLLLWKLLSIG